MDDLKVFWWPIDKPIPYSRNSRKIPERGRRRRADLWKIGVRLGSRSAGIRTRTFRESTLAELDRFRPTRDRLLPRRLRTGRGANKAPLFQMIQSTGAAICGCAANAGFYAAMPRAPKR